MREDLRHGIGVRRRHHEIFAALEQEHRHLDRAQVESPRRDSGEAVVEPAVVAAAQRLLEVGRQVAGETTAVHQRAIDRREHGVEAVVDAVLGGQHVSDGLADVRLDVHLGPLCGERELGLAGRPHARAEVEPREVVRRDARDDGRGHDALREARRAPAERVRAAGRDPPHAEGAEARRGSRGSPRCRPPRSRSYGPAPATTCRRRLRFERDQSDAPLRSRRAVVGGENPRTRPAVVVDHGRAALGSPLRDAQIPPVARGDGDVLDRASHAFLSRDRRFSLAVTCRGLDADVLRGVTLPSYRDRRKDPSARERARAGSGSRIDPAATDSQAHTSSHSSEMETGHG